MFDAILVAVTCALGATFVALLVVLVVGRLGSRGSASHLERPQRRGWVRNQTLIVGSMVMIPQLALLPFGMWLLIFGTFLIGAYVLRRMRDEAGR